MPREISKMGRQIIAYTEHGGGIIEARAKPRPNCAGCASPKNSGACRSCLIAYGIIRKGAQNGN